MSKCCLGCAHCDRYTALGGEQRMRCWSEENVVDHACAMSIKEAEQYVCSNFITPEDWQKEQLEEAKSELYNHLHQVKGILEEYPELIKETSIGKMSDELSEAQCTLGYTTSGNLAHNKPIINGCIKRAAKILNDLGMLHITHDVKVRMENLGL